MKLPSLSQKQFAVVLMISAACLLGMTFLTRPSRVGPFGVLVWFALLYATFVCLLASIRSRLSRKPVNRYMLFHMMVVALLIMAILALRSLGQLHARDLILLGGLVGVSVFYFRRR